MTVLFQVLLIQQILLNFVILSQYLRRFWNRSVPPETLPLEKDLCGLF